MAEMNSIESVGSVAVRAWPLHEELTPEVLGRTVDACAWLIGIAEKSVEAHGWDASIVRWLDSIGATAHETLRKGLQ